jgi:hypothetical protein
VGRPNQRRIDEPGALVRPGTDCERLAGSLGVLAWPHPWRDSRGVCLPVFANAAPPGNDRANLPALDVVLADMDARALASRYCLGDLVGYGTFPNEVVAAIRERNIPTLMGNYDQGVGNDSDDCGCAYKEPISEALGKRSIAWSNPHTTANNKAYLRDLPAHIPLQLGDLRVIARDALAMIVHPSNALTKPQPSTMVHNGPPITAGRCGSVAPRPQHGAFRACDRRLLMRYVA